MRVRGALAVVTLSFASVTLAQGKGAGDAGKVAENPAAAAPAAVAKPVAPTATPAAKPATPAAATKPATAVKGKPYPRSVKYPESYRHWTHTKTAIIQQGHPLFEQFGGIHHVYANDNALNAWRENKPLPNGAVLVFDLLEAKSEDNMVSEGPRKVLAVMERDTTVFGSTGGWGFEAFKGDTRDRLVTDAQACFGCHQKQAAASEFVFSSWRH